METYLIIITNFQIPPPKEMISSVPIPGTDSITFHHLTAYTNVNPSQVPEGVFASSPPYFPLDDLPFKMQVNDIHSKFVEVKFKKCLSYKVPKMNIY